MFGCIIQARMESERFPGKVMKKVDGKKPSLFFTVSQLKNSKYINKIVIATSTKKSDDAIQKLSQEIGIECFRGSFEDVLDRYYICSKNFQFKNIIRITGDCPLIDPKIVDDFIKKFQTNNYDYIHNFDPRTFPDGMDIEIFTHIALKKAWKKAKLASEREHVTAYFRNNSDKFKIKNIKNRNNFSKYRITLDYKEDLKLIKNIIKGIPERPIFMKDIIYFLEKNPDFLKINQKYEANEGYKKSLELDKKLRNN